MGKNKHVEVNEKELFIKTKNIEFENVKDYMSDLFFNDTFFSLVMKFYSKTWNKLTVAERKKQFEILNAYVSGYFQGELIEPGVIFLDNLVDDRTICTEYDCIKANKQAFISKDNGLMLLKSYMNSLCTLYIYKSAFEITDYHPSMSKLTEEYYFNSCGSFLYNLWNNYLEYTDPDYYNQPIVIDSYEIIEDIYYDFIKKLYKMNQTIDQEMGILLDMHIEYQAEAKEREALRKKMVQKNEEQILKLEEECENITRFLEKTRGDFSEFSDDEFFELFNEHYRHLITYDDQYKIHRIESVLNGLIRRTFNNFDTSNIVFPNYKVSFKDKYICYLDRQLDNCDVIKAESLTELLAIVISDIEKFAYEHELHVFKDEKEKEDYKIMKEWITLKGEIKEQTFEYSIVSSYLNIRFIKSHQLFSDLCNRVDNAIAKSSFIPLGKSIISTHNDAQAYYDFEKFKTGKNAEEMSVTLMNLVKEDLMKMKSNSTIVKKGGVR